MMALAAALTCCGDAGSNVVTTCAVEGLAVVDAEVLVDCEAVATNVALAKKLVVGTGALDEADWDATFAGTRLVIRDTDLLDEGAYGTYSPSGNEINVNRHMHALVHEMVHRALHAAHDDPDGAHTDARWALDGAFRAAGIAYHRDMIRF